MSALVSVKLVYLKTQLEETWHRVCEEAAESESHFALSICQFLTAIKVVWERARSTRTECHRSTQETFNQFNGSLYYVPRK